MGLPEKRAIAKINTETLPKFQSLLDAAAGTHLELWIDWESYAEQPIEVIEVHVPERGLTEIVKCVELVCQDELGKSALQEGLTRVVLRCPSKGQPNTLSLEDKTLTVLLGDPLDTGYWPADRLVEFIEAKL